MSSFAKVITEFAKLLTEIDANLNEFATSFNGFPIDLMDLLHFKAVGMSIHVMSNGFDQRLEISARNLVENDHTDVPHLFCVHKIMQKTHFKYFFQDAFFGEVFAAIRGTGTGPSHGQAMGRHGLAMPGHGPHFWACTFFLV